MGHCEQMRDIRVGTCCCQKKQLYINRIFYLELSINVRIIRHYIYFWEFLFHRFSTIRNNSLIFWRKWIFKISFYSRSYISNTAFELTDNRCLILGPILNWKVIDMPISYIFHFFLSRSSRLIRTGPSFRGTFSQGPRVPKRTVLLTCTSRKK